MCFKLAFSERWDYKDLMGYIALSQGEEKANLSWIVMDWK